MQPVRAVGSDYKISPCCCSPCTLLLAVCDRTLKVVKETLGLFLTMPVVGVAAVLTLPSAKSLLSPRVMELSDKFLTQPLYAVRERVVTALPPLYTNFTYNLKLKTNWTFVAAGSVLEELFFRYLIQSVALTDAPKLILRKISPSYESVVDHKIVKAARVIFTSALFALTHVTRLGHFPGLLVPQLIMGIYFSYRRETGATIGELSLVHIGFNVLGALVAGGITDAPPKIEDFM